MQESKVGGALTGAVIAAAANWARYDDDTQRRLRNVRQDAEHALEVVRDMQSRGEAIRSRLPTGWAWSTRSSNRTMVWQARQL